ncbi:DMT family transporter [Anderseniella sp. Alg231-50]|uniref:DMT family transporter n=1 Tax=Anderseniella sp. Alg231-50 TaxID=1922226 RepID=UPI00307BF294
MQFFDMIARYTPGPTAAWLWLLAAGIAEIGWAVGLKFSDGFTRPLPTAWTVMCLVASFPMLAIALKSIPISTGYAVWTSIGIAGAVAVGVLFLQEPASLAKFACLGMILTGVVGLKLIGT